MKPPQQSTPTKSRRQYSWKVVIAAALALGCGSYRDEPAEAHFGHDPASYFFDGSLYGDIEATSRADPVSLVFERDPAPAVGDGLATIAKVDDMLGHWTGPGEMGPGPNPLCRVFSSRQYALWLHYFDPQVRLYRTQYRSSSVDELQRVAVTRGGFPGCRVQYHIRVFSDTEHKENTSYHTAGQWAIAGVHRDTYIPSDHKHRPSIDWDTAANVTVKALKDYCSFTARYYNARAHRYYGPKGYSFNFSGFMSGISTREISLSPTYPACAGASGVED